MRENIGYKIVYYDNTDKFANFKKKKRTETTVDLSLHEQYFCVIITTASN